jgi:hypothetical protein
MTAAPKLTDLELALLIVERDTCQYKKERIDELINKIGKAKGISNVIETPKTAATSDAKTIPGKAPEITFTTLNFERLKSVQLGDFEIAYKANNVEDKWTYAFNILSDSKATIKDRYHSEGYQFSYWVYDEGKIYRQKLSQRHKGGSLS